MCTGLEDETLLPAINVEGVKRPLQDQRILLYCNARERKLNDFL